MNSNSVSVPLDPAALPGLQHGGPGEPPRSGSFVEAMLSVAVDTLIALTLIMAMVAFTAAVKRFVPAGSIPGYLQRWGEWLGLFVYSLVAARGLMTLIFRDLQLPRVLQFAVMHVTGRRSLAIWLRAVALAPAFALIDSVVNLGVLGSVVGVLLIFGWQLASAFRAAHPRV